MRVHSSVAVRRYSVLLLIYYCFTYLQLANATQIEWVDGATATHITQPLDTLVEVNSAGSSALEILKFGRFSTEYYRPSLQPGESVYWYKLELIGPASPFKQQRLYIWFDNPVITYLDVFVFKGEELVAEKNMGSSAYRTDSKSTYVGQFIDVEVSPFEKVTLLIRKQSNSPAIIPITLYNQQGFQQHAAFTHIFWGGSIAVLVILALYNVVIYSLVRNPAYVWYLGFYLVSFLYFSGLHEFGSLLWPDAMQRWLSQNIMLLNFLLLGIVLRFAVVFLDAKNTTPRHYSFYRWFALVIGLGFFTAFFVPEYQLIAIFGLLQTLGSVYAVSMAVAAYRSGYYPARFFLLSWSMVLIGAGVGISTFLDLIPANFFTMHAFFFGSVCELVLLSVALADRVSYTESMAMTSAFTDPRTLQPNYSYFKSQYFQLAPKSPGESSRKVMLLIHLDGVKKILGLLGPISLERIYQEHIQRIERYARSSHWIVPFILPDKKLGHLISLPSNHILLVAQVKNNLESVVIPLLAVSEESIKVEKLDSKLTFTIGIADFSADSLDVQETYRQAQMALLTCEGEKREWCEYNTLQDDNVRKHMFLLTELKIAIEQQALEIFVQPQFDIGSGSLQGGEVLVRWFHPEEGMIPPNVFIPLAEQSKLIYQITKLVFEKSCAWLSAVKDLPTGFHLSVNLSVIDIQQEDLIEYINEMVGKYRLSTRSFVFEITESAVMTDHQLFLKVIAELQSRGFGVAIDDFGTGYSSMRYMQQMSADVIKIDMSFVRDIHCSPINQKIVKAIIQMASSTHSLTVAEGIETNDELQILKSLGAHTVQGYLTGKPIAAHDFEMHFLRKSDILSSNLKINGT